MPGYARREIAEIRKESRAKAVKYLEENKHSGLPQQTISLKTTRMKAPVVEDEDENKTKIALPKNPKFKANAKLRSKIQIGG